MEKTTIINKLEKLKRLDNYNLKLELEELINNLKIDEIKSGKIKNTSILGLCKDMIKNAKNFNKQLFMNTYKVDNKYCLCDSMRLIEFNNENDEIAKRFYSKENNCNINIDKITNGYKYNEVKINIENLNKIINYNKFKKQEEKIPFVFEKDSMIIGANAEWLKQMLDISKDNIVYVTTSSYAPIMIKTKEYKMVLLPIKLSEENTITKFNEIISM